MQITWGWGFFGMNYLNYLRSTSGSLLLESTWTLHNMVIQISPVQKLREMFGLKVFRSQTCHYRTCHFANAFEYKGTGLYHSRTKHYKLSRAFIQLLADRLHGVNPFSPLPLCKSFYFAYRPGLLTHVIWIYWRNTQALWQQTSIDWRPGTSAMDRCVVLGTQWGWGMGPERERGRWDSGSFLEWTGLAVVSLRGICMFKETTQSSRVLSARWLKSTSETSSVEFQMKFRKLDEVEPSLWKFVSGTTVWNLYSEE